MPGRSVLRIFIYVASNVIIAQDVQLEKNFSSLKSMSSLNDIFVAFSFSTSFFKLFHVSETYVQIIRHSRDGFSSIRLRINIELR